jgi:hypothetical protein
MMATTFDRRVQGTLRAPVVLLSPERTLPP